MDAEKINQIAKKYPDITIQIRLGELIEVIKFLIQESRYGFERIIHDEGSEGFMYSNEVMELLRISHVTLWRWEKIGYLKPIDKLGKRKCYKTSDIKRILNGKQKKESC